MNGPRRDVLAVVAFVLALVPCCPFISLLGAGLGLLAMHRIRVAGGAMGGYRLAVAAVLVGISLTMLSTLTFAAVQRSVSHHLTLTMIEHVRETIREAADGREQEAFQRWSAGSQRAMTANDLRAFGQATVNRYGLLQRLSISSQTPAGGWLQQRMDVAGLFVFERRTLTGAASFEIGPPGRGLMPGVRLRSLLIEDHELGDLQLPTPIYD